MSSLVMRQKNCQKLPGTSGLRKDGGADQDEMMTASAYPNLTEGCKLQIDITVVVIY